MTALRAATTKEWLDTLLDPVKGAQFLAELTSDEQKAAEREYLESRGVRADAVPDSIESIQWLATDEDGVVDILKLVRAPPARLKKTCLPPADSCCSRS